MFSAKRIAELKLRVQNNLVKPNRRHLCGLFCPYFVKLFFQWHHSNKQNVFVLHFFLPFSTFVVTTHSLFINIIKLRVYYLNNGVATVAGKTWDFTYKRVATAANKLVVNYTSRLRNVSGLFDLVFPLGKQNFRTWMPTMADNFSEFAYWIPFLFVSEMKLL